MRWIYLSPHFDDAVLSCGGLIHEQTRQGEAVSIWTLMAGYPWRTKLSAFAERTHIEWGTGPVWRTVYVRRREDRQAASLTGARWRHFCFPDMIYRYSRKAGFLYPQDVFVERHADDAALPARIARTLSRHLRPGDVLVCPLGIGAHLDHVFVREAAEQLKHPRWYYADVPYLLQHPETLAPATRGMISRHFPVTEAGLQAWQAGVGAYTSQLSTLFRGEIKMPEAIRRYWAQESGLRLWRVE